MTHNRHFGTETARMIARTGRDWKRISGFLPSAAIVQNWGIPNSPRHVVVITYAANGGANPLFCGEFDSHREASAAARIAGDILVDAFDKGDAP